MKRVAVVRRIFLPISETFIYEELIKLKNFKPFVFTQRREHAKNFPFDQVTVELNNWNLLRHFRRKKIDLIHARFGNTAVDLIEVKRRSGLPMITSFHGNDHPDNQKNREKYRNLWKLFRVGELFTVTNMKMKKALIRHGCPKYKIVVHHSGIDLSRIPFKQRTIESDTNLIRILFVGRLVEKKGAEYLIRAFPMIKRHFPNVRLTIVGEGELRPRLAYLIRNLGLTEHVELLGKKGHQEVLDLMNQSHIFCLPSVTLRNGSQEGIPNVLKEAMASGLPVVSTNHAGIPELISNEKNGFLVKEKDSRELAKKIVQVLEHPEKWNEVCLQARTKIEQDFEVTKQIAHLEKIYDYVLSRHTRNSRG